MDVVELHRRTVAGFLEQAATIGPDPWDDPTPCSAWSVRDLVNHLAAEDLWTTPLLEGRTIAEVGDAFDGDVLGDDPHRSLGEAAAAATAAVAEHLPAGGTVHLSYGDEAAEEYVRQLSADHLLHAWDLAAAVGHELRPDADVVAEVAAWFAAREDLYRAAGIIGPRPSVQGATDWEQLLVASGRDPSWGPEPAPG